MGLLSPPKDAENDVKSKKDHKDSKTEFYQIKTKERSTQKHKRLEKIDEREINKNQDIIEAITKQSVKQAAQEEKRRKELQEKLDKNVRIIKEDELKFNINKLRINESKKSDVWKSFCKNYKKIVYSEL